MTSLAASIPNRLKWAGFALGFALGGFFDGILLHQILRWHHLLSGLEQARQDISFLILTDGLFHFLMYVIAAGGLWLLWRARKDFAAPTADRGLLALALIGFGTWHVIDAVLSHWLLGIHRIRMDADNPLFWDILWLIAFGLLPLALGMRLARRHQKHPRLLSSPLALVLATAIAAPLAALPAPQQDDVVMVVFRPGVSAAHALASFQTIDGRLIWNDADERVWAIDMSSGGDAAGLYAHGALLVSNSIVPVGCLDWFQI